MEKIKISKETHPQYFTESYRSSLKGAGFDYWYRGQKAAAFLMSNIHGLLRANDEWFKQNPEYVEGPMCGKLKEIQ